MYCTSCGRHLEDDARFCKDCGAPTAQSAPPGATAAPEVRPQIGPPERSRGAPGPRFGEGSPPPPGITVEQPAGPDDAVVERQRGPTLRTPGGDFELAGFGIRFGGTSIDLVI